jgi:23S rRNA pseudouridine1911/1915/1917 synthase
VTTLSYLYNDGEIFAVYKPAGLHSVRLPTEGGASVADLLLKEHPELEHAGRTPGDAGLIHRLDLDTSGILLGTRSREVWEELFQLSLSGGISKQYAALVEGTPEDSVTITSFIGSPHRGAKKVKVYERKPPAWARALEGTSNLELHERLPHINASIALISASPARRHQVRAHAAHIGHPLVGDTLYGSPRSLGDISSAPRAFMLHATRLSFEHPQSRRHVTIESPFATELCLLTP